MPAPVVLLLVFVGFGLIVAAGTWLGAGSHLALDGLFPAQGRSDWPRGVQEGDLPRFAVDHVDSLRHPAQDVASICELDRRESALTTVEPVALRVGLVELHR